MALPRPDVSTVVMNISRHFLASGDIFFTTAADPTTYSADCRRNDFANRFIRCTRCELCPSDEEDLCQFLTKERSVLKWL